MPGTASPLSGLSTQSPAGSAQATPTSSTSNLVESRKPMHIDGPTQSHAGAPSVGGSQNNMNANQNSYEQRDSIGRSGSSGSSGQSPTTHGRHNQPPAPSVIISSSAPVRDEDRSLSYQNHFANSLIVCAFAGLYRDYAS